MSRKVFILRPFLGDDQIQNFTCSVTIAATDEENFQRRVLFTLDHPTFIEYKSIREKKIPPLIVALGNCSTDAGQKLVIRPTILWDEEMSLNSSIVVPAIQQYDGLTIHRIHFAGNLERLSLGKQQNVVQVVQSLTTGSESLPTPIVLPFPTKPDENWASQLAAIILFYTCLATGMPLVRLLLKTFIGGAIVLYVLLGGE